MNQFLDILIHLAIPELLLLILGCLIAGFAISFLWDNRKDGETILKIQLKKQESESDQWRLKYYDICESKEKAITELSDTIKKMGENEESQAVEIEELSLLNQQLMLKNKNTNAQHAIYAQEIEILKENISRLEIELSELNDKNLLLQEKTMQAQINSLDELKENTINSQIEALESNYLLLKAQLSDMKEQITKTN